MEQKNSEEQRNNNILKEKIAWRTKIYNCVNKWRIFFKKNDDIEVDWNSWWRELTYVKDIMVLKECKKRRYETETDKDEKRTYQKNDEAGMKECR